MYTGNEIAYDKTLGIERGNSPCLPLTNIV